MLLVGANGFAGRHVRDAAGEAGLEVVGAERTPGEADLACDLLEPARSRTLRAARPSLIVNMAGAASVAASWDGRRRPSPSTPVACSTCSRLSQGSAAGPRPASPRARSTARPTTAAAVHGRPCPAPAEPLRRQQGGDGVDLRPVRARPRPADRGLARLQPHSARASPTDFAASSFARQIAEAERGGETQAVARRWATSTAPRLHRRPRRRAGLLRSLRAAARPAPSTSARASRCRSGVLIVEMRVRDPAPIESAVDDEPTRPSEPPLYGSPTASARRRAGSRSPARDGPTRTTYSAVAEEARGDEHDAGR